MPSLSNSIVPMMTIMYSSGVSMAMNGTTVDCNHMVADGFLMVADMCLADGVDSQMLACAEDGVGYFRTWALNTNCEGNHEFEAAIIAEFGYEVVCDAEPCHIAVLEDYSGGSDSSSSSNSSDSSDSSDSDSSSSSTMTTTTDPGLMSDSNSVTTTMIAARRLQDSDASTTTTT